MTPAARHEIIAMLFCWACGFWTGWRSYAAWMRKPQKGDPNESSIE